MSLECKFVVGNMYMCNPSIEGQPKKVAVVCGRQGRRIQLAWVDELTIAIVESYNGREHTMAERSDGIFSITPLASIDTYTTTEILEILKRRKI